VLFSMRDLVYFPCPVFRLRGHEGVVSNQIQVFLDFIHVQRQTCFGPEKIGLQIKESNTCAPISPNDQNKMFAAGYTTKKEHSGLGLYIIKQIVERNGGQLELREAKEYSGVEFVIHVPWKY
jgi:signal transduction histidine kinase